MSAMNWDRVRRSKVGAVVTSDPPKPKCTGCGKAFWPKRRHYKRCNDCGAP